jgi:hypothetical protein
MPFLKDPQFKAAPDDLLERKAWHSALVAEAAEYDCFVTSTPGNREVFIECLPTSGWPAVLRKRGYLLRPEEDGQRILPNSVREPMAIGANGELAPLVPGSTMATTMVVHHAGIHKTRRFRFFADVHGG